MDNWEILLHLLKISPLLVSEMIAVYKATEYVLDNKELFDEKKPTSVDKIIRKDINSNNESNKKLDLSKLRNEVIFSQIETFSNFIVNNFSSNDLFNFYSNVLDLKVNFQNDYKSNSICKTIASYNVNNNSIIITDISTKSAIYHELFHMASTAIYNDNLCCGFAQNNKSISVGTGINEGYTELLNERYFSADNNAYPFETYAVSRLEQVIGRDLMESLYLNADLFGLIEKLENYMEIHSVMKFIADMDFLNKHLCIDNVKKIENKIIRNSLRDVSHFLLDAYSNKLLLLLNMSLIDIEEFRNSLSFYLDSIVVYKRFSNNEYNIFFDEEIKNYFDAIIKKADLLFSNKKNNNRVLRK